MSKGLILANDSKTSTYVPKPKNTFAPRQEGMWPVSNCSPWSGQVLHGRCFFPGEAGSACSEGVPLAVCEHLGPRGMVVGAPGLLAPWLMHPVSSLSGKAEN